MSAKHTPGPWGLIGMTYVVGQLRGGGRPQVAEISCMEAVRGEEDSNASLIAAAPELLEALRTTEEYVKRTMMGVEEKEPGCGCPCEAHGTLRIIRAAIAKAEGRS